MTKPASGPDPSADRGHRPAAVRASARARARSSPRRAARFEHLAERAASRPTSRFLAGLADVQAALADGLPSPAARPRGSRPRRASRDAADRPHALAGGAGARRPLDALLDRAPRRSTCPTPRAPRSTRCGGGRRRRARLAGPQRRSPTTSPSRRSPRTSASPPRCRCMPPALAATLDADRLVPIRVGVCPGCGGRPAASLVVGSARGASRARATAPAPPARRSGTRSASSARLRLDQGHRLPRVLGDDGGGQGRGLRRVPRLGEDPLPEAATPALDPIADDVATPRARRSMRETEFRRGAVRPLPRRLLSWTTAPRRLPVGRPRPRPAAAGRGSPRHGRARVAAVARAPRGAAAPGRRRRRRPRRRRSRALDAAARPRRCARSST